jgi:hypothetical protein
MLNRVFYLTIASALLCACGASAPMTQTVAPVAPLATNAPPPTPLPTQTPTSTPKANLPIVLNGAKRILFINGDHIPENGYPHSRVSDDGSKPESFSKLRKEVLEDDLKLSVDEFILTASNTFTPGLFSPYAIVVVGSNGRVFNADEVSALTSYFDNGGSLLFYADFQYGPNNWASDNSFLKTLGVEVFPDNFQPTTQITDIVSSHPIMQGVVSFATEGSSQFLIRADTLTANIVLSKCSPLERLGCAVKPEEQAKIKPGDVVACTWIRENAVGGRLAGTCDRNTFHNGPGIGTSLDEFSNRIYARNLFSWLMR